MQKLLSSMKNIPAMFYVFIAYSIGLIVGYTTGTKDFLWVELFSFPVINNTIRLWMYEGFYVLGLLAVLIEGHKTQEGKEQIGSIAMLVLMAFLIIVAEPYQSNTFVVLTIFQVWDVAHGSYTAAKSRGKTTNQ